VHGHPRWILWLLAAGVDFTGGLVGFVTPWLGRSHTSDWDIAGGHFAERCQGFIMIALGESIVTIGTVLSGARVDAATVTSFVVAFTGAVALWWLYFDRSATADVVVLALLTPAVGAIPRLALGVCTAVVVLAVVVSDHIPALSRQPAATAAAR